MIKEFIYSNKPRKVVVIKQTSTTIEGIDLNLLPDDVSKDVIKVVGNYIPTSNESPHFDNRDRVWNKAWRKFLKHKIIESDKET